MISSTCSLCPWHAEVGLVMGLCLAVSILGCFRDPKLDDSQPRRCQTDKNCPWGQICGPDKFCCASSDGKTCNHPGSTGGATGSVDGRPSDGALTGSETGGNGDGASRFYEVGAGGDGPRGTSGTGGGATPDGGIDSPVGGTNGGAGGGEAGNTGSSDASQTGDMADAAGGTGSGGTGTGGTGGTVGQSTATCDTGKKECNGTCIPASECCGGCSGNKPVCSNGTCVARSLGDSCQSPSECASGVCADGVCCNEPCSGICEACNLTGAKKGTCSPTTTPPCRAFVCDRPQLPRVWGEMRWNRGAPEGLFLSANHC